MWKAYFGPGAKIIGIDINPECKKHESDGVEIFIGSQDDNKLLDSVKEKYPQIHIVIDDGSHIMCHMEKTFNELYHFLDRNGVYVVEDTILVTGKSIREGWERTLPSLKSQRD